jgi:flagellar FliJ protein
MSRVKRMQPVLRLAELEADKAGRQLATAQLRMVAEEQKMQQLVDFQLEYRQRLLSAGQTGMTVDRLRLFDGFQHQLNKAILHQQSVVHSIEQDLLGIRQAWQQLDIRQKSLQKMVERLQREHNAELSRAEQRNHDEFSQRRGNRGGWS